MKPRTHFLAIIATLLALLALRLFRFGPHTSPSTTPTDEAVEASNPQLASHATVDTPRIPTLEPQTSTVPHAQQNLATERLPPGSNLQAQLEELARRRGVPLNALTQQAIAELSNAFWQASNGPLDFYGKVVDADGAPLSGATARINCIIFPEHHFATNIITHSNGLFELHGTTGTALRVTVTKEGFQELPGTNEDFFIYYGTTVGSHHPNPNNPVIFTLRKPAELK